MSDVQWSNEPVAPPKAGLSSTAKVVIGCGLLMLLGAGSCLGFVVWGGSKVVKAVGGAGEKEWPVMRQLASQLSTEAGARAVWESNPGLSQTFTSEDDFLHEMAAIRPELEPLPEKKPEMFGGRLTYSYASKNGFTHVEAGYQLAPGKALVFSFEGDKVVNIQLQRMPLGGVPLTGSTGGDSSD